MLEPLIFSVLHIRITGTTAVITKRPGKIAPIHLFSPPIENEMLRIDHLFAQLLNCMSLKTAPTEIFSFEPLSVVAPQEMTRQFYESAIWRTV